MKREENNMTQRAGKKPMELLERGRANIPPPIQVPATRNKAFMILNAWEMENGCARTWLFVFIFFLLSI
jgi:hypothetical protein